MTAIHDEADNQLHQRTLDGFREQDYEVLDASAEQGSPCAITGRANDSEVVLTERLRQALRRLNPAVSQDLLEQAREQLTQNYSLRELAAANQDVYRLLKYGIKLDVASPAAAQVRGTPEEKVTVQVIDWKNPQNNDFLLVTGLSINGQLGRGRLDYVGFVNGLPLLLPVVRASGRQQDRLRRLYDLVEKDYKQRFPQLFWYNALILLSDGQHSKMGSMATTWEHFVEWKRVEREDEPENTTLETLLKGTCARGRLLDIVENFTLFKPVAGGLLKIVARCHQYLGVNAAFARMQRIKELGGKIGVFWHTQGAGKSYSMIFFEQKVQHKLSGNWTFVVVTDREDLDKQIYENFAQIGVISEPQERVRATSRDELKRLLRENHSIIFTLIQKFQTEQPQQPYPKLSDRDDIIVMTDEAHRSQYDTLAANMRTALPNASFIGFTGTPLIDREEHETRETFGPYISKYPFLQAIRDGVTVPLIYENRTPEIELQVAEVAEAIQEMERRTGLSEEQKQKLRQELFQRDTLISSAARLDFIAEDIVRHFMNRGYRGKAMVVSIDKITAVRTYNRVRQAWLRYQAELERQRQLESDPERRMALEQELQYMQTTDMAVVISASDASEEGKVAQFNREHPTEQIDIRPHHERYEREPLDKHFKDPDNSLRIVFVCFMWMTGFDVPCLSTLYLDHPMEDHTLMQALARPNRVFGEEKAYGQVVDYVGIYHKLLKALNTYAQPDQGITEADVRMPLSEKGELIGELERALADIDTFCQRNGVNLSTALAALEAAHTGAEREAQIQAAANALIIREDVKQNFLSLVWDAYRLYQTLLPDKEAARFKARIFFLRAVQQTIFAAMSGQDIGDALTRGRRIIAEGTSIYDYVSRQTSHDPDALLGTFDLSQIDFDALAASMRAENIYLQAERLRSLLTLRLQRMIRVNPKRADYLKKLEDITTKYNRESANNADYPTEIIEFARQVRDEELRPAREQMSEEELAIADLLLSPELHLTVAERRQVKETARTLLKTIQGSNLLVRDWHKKPMMKAGMKRIIGETLDQHLPASYVPAIYESLCQEIFIYILTRYRDYPDGSTMISA